MRNAPQLFATKLLQRLKETPELFNIIAAKYHNPQPFIEQIIKEGRLLQTILDKINTYKLSSTNQTYLITNFQALTFIKMAFDYYLHSINETCSMASLASELTTSELTRLILNRIKSNLADTTQRCLSEIDKFHQTHFSPIDHRSYTPGHQEDKKLRRMDSLSRLLSLSNMHSVCSAVTLIEGKLIISANVCFEKEENLVQKALQDRLNALRGLMQHLTNSFEKTYGVEWRLTQKINDLLEAELRNMNLNFLQQQGIHVTQPNFQQALYKFTHALLIDLTIFTPEEKHIFLYHTPIILTPHYLRQNESFKIYPIDRFHAEQLIKQYIEQQECPPLGPVTIGVSKLCCGTCMDVLSSSLTVIYNVRGTHGERYSGVVNTSKQVVEPSTPKRPSPQTARSSPRNSPSQVIPAAQAKAEPSLGSISPNMLPRQRPQEFFTPSSTSLENPVTVNRKLTFYV